uniref:Myosin motor domain-containing protein n=1 Tax=Glossina austeni TaxID=7395 RepID=A0A1A9USI7_GLOAU
MTIVLNSGISGNRRRELSYFLSAMYGQSGLSEVDIREREFQREQFKETIQAMQVLGFDPRQISDILKILSSILHLGNIKFATKYKKDKEKLDLDGCDIYIWRFGFLN